jgi:hypothetical protein
MKALYALALICLTAPALAFDLGEQTAAAEFESAAPVASVNATVDPATIWHEFDYDVKHGIKVAKIDRSTDFEQDTTASIPSEIWHEYDYDVKHGIKVAKDWQEYEDGIQVAKADPSEIWHEYDYDLRDGIQVAKADSSTIDQEVTASIPSLQAILGDYYIEEAFVTGALPY